MAKSLKQLRFEYSQLLESMNENLRLQIEALAKTSGVGVGAVYIVNQVGTNNYKIGHTTNYEQRKYQFDVRLPFEIEEVFVFQTDNYRKVELKIHEMLAPHRLNNSEFFELTQKQVDNLIDIISDIDNKIIQEVKPTEDAKKEISSDPDEELRNQVLEYMEEMKIDIKDLSTSGIQRRFRVGYSRASRIKEQIILNHE